MLRKQERLEARVTRHQKRLIARAASLRGSSVTDFVVASAQSAAQATIEDFERMKLAGAASAVFVDALLNPPVPSAVARAAAQRYRARART